MGTFDISRLDIGQAHPAIVKMTGLITVRDFSVDELTKYVENGLSKNYHVTLDWVDRSRSSIRVTLFYGARGAWPVDLRKRFDKLPVYKVFEPPTPLTRDDRVQLCGHDKTTSDCKFTNYEAHMLIQLGLERVREMSDLPTSQHINLWKVSLPDLPFAESNTMRLG